MNTRVAPAVVLTLFLSACSGLGEVPAALRSSGVGSAARESNAQSASVSVIYSFRGPDGATPEAAVIADAHGNLYGTTEDGGAPSSFCYAGCGTAFELISQNGGGWKERVLHSFNDSTGALAPTNPLILDASGNLYSAISVADVAGAAYGLLRHGPAWHYAQIYAFRGGRDGQSPLSGLTYVNGTLYGTTESGGNGGSGGNGTVYALSGHGTQWKETVIHRFLASAHGATPRAGLISDANGNFYGTTSFGGNPACPAGCGTAFELSPGRSGGWTAKVLHKFNGYDGFDPLAPLVFDSHGDLFGSTNQGQGGDCVGAGCGTIFELSAAAKNRSRHFAVVHAFSAKQGGGPAGQWFSTRREICMARR